MSTRVIARRYTLEVPEPTRPGCTIWRGRDATTGAAVVVTLLDAHAEADTTLAALAAVRHPALPVVLDHGVDGDVRYLITPERAGVALRARGTEALAVAEVADLGAALADALAALHATGLAQGAVDFGAIVRDASGPPRLEDLATAGLARPADQPDDDVRGLAALLRELLGITDGTDPLEVAGIPPRFAGLLQSMASIAPPTAADARDALRRIARDADAAAWDPFPPAPVALPAPVSPPVASPQRSRVLVMFVALLAVGVLILAAIVVAGVVDRRDREQRAAATQLPGPVTTQPTVETVEGGAVGTTAQAPPEPAGPNRTPRPVRIVGISALDPAGDIGENSDQVRLAIDGSRATGWSTELYKQGVIERKAGVGLHLTLAVPTRVRRLVLRSVPTGATVVIYGTRGELPARVPRDWPRLSEPTELARPRAIVPVARVAPVTDLLVWIVGLPPVPGGYAVRLDDIRVVGVPTGA